MELRYKVVLVYKRNIEINLKAIKLDYVPHKRILLEGIMLKRSDIIWLKGVDVV